MCIDDFNGHAPDDDRKSWERLIEKYWKTIYDLARQAGLSDAEAQDVAHETLVEIVGQRQRFESHSSPTFFKAWLLRLTRWRIIDKLRKKKGGDRGGGSQRNE